MSGHTVRFLVLLALVCVPAAPQERPGVPIPGPGSPFWGGVPTGAAAAHWLALADLLPNVRFPLIIPLVFIMGRPKTRGGGGGGAAGAH